MRFVSTTNPNNPDIFAGIRQNIEFLKAHPDTSQGFSGMKLINAKKQPKSLGKLLCSSTHKLKKEIVRCNKARCKICQILITGEKIALGGQDFYVNTQLDCDSKYVVYLLQCSCGDQYIGQTSNFRLRINLHRNQIMNHAHWVLPVSEHIYACAVRRGMDPPFVCCPFYKTFSEDSDFLKQKETMFIAKFNPKLNS